MSADRSAPPPPCPYPGLSPFTSEHARLFCGRTSEVKEVVDSLLAHRITVLLGPSGVGKSSLLNVGVVPEVERRNEARATDPVAAPFYTAVPCGGWGDVPAAVVRARLQELIPPDDAAELRDAPLASVLAAAASHVGGRLLLVLDQFEELLAGGREADPELVEAIAEAPPAVHVLIVVRADALSELDRLADEIPGLLGHLVRIEHLGPRAAREAILAPAERWNGMPGTDPITVEDELADAVIEQTTERDLDPPGVRAPLLQLVMRRLWCEVEHEPDPDRRVLDPALLTRLGETGGIVAGHVDRALAGWPRRDRDLLARVLDHLVAASGAKIPQSAPVLAKRVGEAEADVTRVLERLTVPRILERVGERYQLYHDALSEPLLDWRRRWELAQARRRGWLRLGIVLAVVAVLLFAAAYARAFEPLESLAVGARFELRGPKAPPQDIVLVAIDKRSLDVLDDDWPVFRPSLARAVAWIAKGHPKVIAYDGVLAARSYPRKRDDPLLNALLARRPPGRVVIAAEATAPGGRTNVFGGSDLLRGAHIQPGYSNFRDDVDGVIHRPVYAVDDVPSFAVAASRIATGRRVARGDVEHAWIDFYGPAGTFPRLPYWRVLKQRVPPQVFHDKIVVIGPTNPGDTRYRPVWGIHERGMPDVELQATAIDTVRRGLPLRSAPWWVTALSILVLALLPPLLHRRRLTLPATVAISLAGGLLFLLVAYAAFAVGGWMLLVIAPLAALLFALLAVVLIAATPPPERRRPRAARTTTTALLALALLAAASASASAASFGADPLVQVGAKLGPSDGTPYRAFGSSAALSADGGTALVGAPDDADGDGAAWVFVKQNGRWLQQGPKLVPQDSDGGAQFGTSVALSADGSTALVGGYGEDDEQGAAWVFTRAGGTWTQQGPELLPNDPGLASPEVFFGYSVALSADGDTALVGGYGDGFGYGAAWAFTRSAGTWSQQGPKLTVPGEVLGSDGTYSWFGSAVALSSDGDTALIGGDHDADGVGAAWVFARSGMTWTQGAKLTGAGESGLARFGRSVALSGDGATALVGGEDDGSSVGAAWAFTQSGGSWLQQGAKLTAADGAGESRFGSAVALDATGDDAVIGGWSDANELGAVWPFVRSGGSWTPHGAKLVPTDGSDDVTSFGSAVAVSADAGTLLLGGNEDNSGNGAAWLFAPADALLTVPTLSISAGSANTPDGVWDDAELFDGDNPTGTLTFSLYGPGADDCSGTPAGTLTIPVEGNDFYGTEGRLTVRDTGTYLDVVTYSGDARNAARSTVCGESELSVLLQPTLSVGVGGTREIGATLQLSASLQGGSRPSGTVEMHVSGPTDPGCDAPLLSRTLTMAGGHTETVDYMPPMVGTYRVEASYSGDADNLGAYRFCDDPAAQIVVDRATPAVGVAPSPSVPVGSPISATAQLGGGSDPTGSVRFVLYPPANAGCAGPPTGVVTAMLAHAAADSGDFATTTAGTYRFLAVYPGDARNRNVQSACDAGSVVVTKREPQLSVSAHGGPTGAVDGTGTIVESASLSGGFAPTGNVSFSLYGPADPHCHLPATFPSTKTLSEGQASQQLANVAPGRYKVVARYGGDGNNAAVSSSCGSASAVVPAGARATLAHVIPGAVGVAVRLACNGRPVQQCYGAVRLAATAGRRASIARTMLVGRRRFQLGAGTAKTVSVRLDQTGRQLLRSRGRLPVAVLVLLKRPDSPLLSARKRVELSAQTR